MLRSVTHLDLMTGEECSGTMRKDRTQYWHDYYQANKKAVAARHKAYYWRNRERLLRYNRERWARDKGDIKVARYYGVSIPEARAIR